MATCGSVSALALPCGQGSLGGLKGGKIYMIAFADLKAISTATTEVYSANSTTGIVTQVGLQSGKTYVAIALSKNNAGVKETGTFDQSKGLNFLTQELSLVLAGLSSENRAFIESVRYQPISVIYKARTGGNYFVIGLDGDLSIKSLETGTGTVETDAAGFTLTFAGVSGSMAPMIDPTVVTSIVTG